MLTAREGQFLLTHEASSTGAPSFHHRRRSEKKPIPGLEALPAADPSKRAHT